MAGAAATSQPACLQGLAVHSRVPTSLGRAPCRVFFQYIETPGQRRMSSSTGLDVVRCSTSSTTEETNAARNSSARTTRRVVGRGSKLIGSGSAVPKHVISNDELSKFVETSDEWIRVRTGIQSRRVITGKTAISLNYRTRLLIFLFLTRANAIPHKVIITSASLRGVPFSRRGDETVTSLSVESARKALEMANVKPEDVDLILLCTSTPDDLFGSAPQVQKELGCTKALAFDLTAACSGFVLGLVTATRFIKGGGYENVLVIGADALSRYVNWTDRGTCILFGDASGALLLQAADDDQDSLLGFDLHSDGNGDKHLHVRLDSAEPKSGLQNGATNGHATLPSRANYTCLEMNGKEVFRFAVKCVPLVVEAALQEAGLTGNNLDWLLLHQANQRILDSVSERLNIPADKVISNLANYGNTSAASIPLALDEAVRSGQVQPGHIVGTAGFGAGLTWGSAIVRWG
ncbi:hypothetical protein AXG93_685s1010 [Marchantia polymorpha subsp. ruderalis]|uniref:Uncharacterized protein n=1 Tax=Marchantia polymorpha subsp. ruderalis TaxID=1480154 RepID=A0A176WGV0_MARPO|nr:hypothetical protein AXG93_685s1010 [Marchantia polymorpha subsp. ruderalis]